MGKKKRSIQDFNGSAVVFVRSKMPTIHHTYSNNRYRAWSNRIGISFVTPSDVDEGKHRPPEAYIHVLSSDLTGGDSDFSRFPIACLKRSRKTVPISLRDNTIAQVKSYLDGGYLDNLSYIEALSNIKKIKTKVYVKIIR